MEIEQSWTATSLDASMTASKPVSNCACFSTQQNLMPSYDDWIYYSHLMDILQSFNGLFSRTTWVSRHQKSKPFWILLEQQVMGSSGISFTICISLSFAPCSRQITVPVPHHSVFTVRMPFLPPNQQHQSTEGITKALKEWCLDIRGSL